MDVKAYPVLSKEFSLSKVYTEKGEDMVIYNTTTKVRARPNAATYEFAKRCRGDKSLKEIIVELSRTSGELPEKILKDLSTVVQKMVKNNMITFVPSPLQPPRPEPGEVTLFKRLTNIILEVTNKCNLRCKHCYNDSGVKRENELTIEDMKKLIDYLADIGVLNIVFSGGEPLLHPDFLDLVEYARSKPLSCIIFTNGTLLTEEIVQQFKTLSILSVATSIDGATPETNDSFRGVPKSFEKTVKSIKMLKKAEIPVRVNVCLHKGILGEIARMLALLKEWGITDYSIWPVSYTGRPEDTDFVITPEEYKTVVKQIKEYECAEGIKNEFPYNPHLVNCGVGRNSLTVRSDGTVVLCPPFPDSTSLGTIQDSLIDIWNNAPLLKKVQHINAAESDMCKGCNHIKVCQGGCMGNYYRITGELGCGDLYECAYFDVYNDYTPVAITRQSRLSIEIR